MLDSWNLPVPGVPQSTPALYPRGVQRRCAWLGKRFQLRVDPHYLPILESDPACFSQTSTFGPLRKLSMP